MMDNPTVGSPARDILSRIDIFQNEGSHIRYTIYKDDTGEADDTLDKCMSLAIELSSDRVTVTAIKQNTRIVETFPLSTISRVFQKYRTGV